jgi:hypothetical protein
MADSWNSDDHYIRPKQRKSKLRSAPREDQRPHLLRTQRRVPPKEERVELQRRDGGPREAAMVDVVLEQMREDVLGSLRIIAGRPAG